jgi:branched-chain amino acid transport system substrate-binding protein
MKKMRRSFPVGLLLSTDGTYKRLGQAALSGAYHALEEINRDPAYDFTLEAVHCNPRGELAAYGEGAIGLMEQGIRHLFGTITSSSRKEIIPDLEQRGGLLWYGCPYEGFESSESVVYLGACPNQTLIPLLRFALREFGQRAFLLGSNYVWGWEINRIAREVIEYSGGAVLGEKYIRLGAAPFGELIDLLLGERPSFVLNNLVGDSSYAFLRDLDAACAGAGLRLPVLSCNFAEAELQEIGPLRAVRLLSCGPFFEELALDFAWRDRAQRDGERCCHFYTGLYTALHLFARALQQAGDPSPSAICSALHGRPLPSVLGPLSISPLNNHTSLPCHIAELQGDRFRVVHSEPGNLPADPYLTATGLHEFQSLRPATQGPRLRIVK